MVVCLRSHRLCWFVAPANHPHGKGGATFTPIAGDKIFREETGMRSLTRRSVLMFATAVLLLSATSAYADTFQFSYSGGGVSASGLLNATPIGGGVYQVTSISGTRNGQPITGLVPCSPIPPATYCIGFGFGYDNLLFPASTVQLDIQALLFTVQGVPNPVNLYGIADSPFPPYVDLTWELAPDGIHRLYTGIPVDLSITRVTPEPSAVLLFGSGLVALAGAMRRKWLG
jgi:hypothetical protein